MLAGQLSRYFSDYRALLPYSLLGLIAGLLSAAAVLAFEWQIEALASLWMDEGSPDNFEGLPAWQRFLIPFSAATLLGLVFSLLKAEDRETGIVHVLSRMHSHYGALPMRNALVQFVGGAFALASGQSGFHPLHGGQRSLEAEPHGEGDDAAQLQACDGDHWHKRVLQRMAEIDDAFGQAPGAGEVYVILSEHFEHFAAHQSHDQRHLVEAEGN